MSNTKTQLELGTSDDVTLVDAAKQGDLAAFEQLVQRHSAMIFRVAMHIVACRADAEELVQDAFFKAFQHLQDFEGRALLNLADQDCGERSPDEASQLAPGYDGFHRPGSGRRRHSGRQSRRLEAQPRTTLWQNRTPGNPAANPGRPAAHLQNCLLIA